MPELMMLFPEGKEKVITFSYDDGVEQDRRLIEIFNKNGLKATFNLNSGCYAEEGTVYPEGRVHRRMSRSMVDETYTNCGHEIAVHGYHHPWWTQMPVGLASNDIIQDRAHLEEQFHRLVRGAAYPYGVYTDSVVEVLKNAGIEYCRTVFSNHDFMVPIDWLRLAPTCHHDDPELMNLAKRFLETKPMWNPYFFYIWGHSYEFEANNNWDRMEKFAAYVGGHDDVWYATNIEIHDYVEAYRSMKFTYDYSMVKNTSDLTIWFKKDQTMYVIKPGELLELK